MSKTSLKKYLTASKTALVNLFSKPNTVMFPAEMVETPEGFRGTPVLVPENCTLCKKCERICPTNAIVISKLNDTESDFLVDLGKCCYCGECEATCNFDAIALQDVWMTSEMDRELLKHKEIVVKRRKK